MLSEQERFWAGEFGREYSQRCYADEHSIAKVAVWADILRRAPMANTFLELGCNVGGNLSAIQILRPDAQLTGVEINEWAAERAVEATGAVIQVGSIYDTDWTPVDMTFTAGVLIHTPPDRLMDVYDKLYTLSNRYIMVMEYYSPRPEAIPYRGHTDRLWKRDFAGEMMDAYPLELIDYRFVYHRDPFPQDDVTWFLLKKEGE